VVVTQEPTTGGGEIGVVTQEPAPTNPKVATQEPASESHIVATQEPTVKKSVERILQEEETIVPQESLAE
jgi:hypothetical protein